MVEVAGSVRVVELEETGSSLTGSGSSRICIGEESDLVPGKVNPAPLPPKP